MVWTLITLCSTLYCISFNLSAVVYCNVFIDHTMSNQQHCTALVTASVYSSDVWIGHSGSLQSLDRDRCWCTGRHQSNQSTYGILDRLASEATEEVKRCDGNDASLKPRGHQTTFVIKDCIASQDTSALGEDFQVKVPFNNSSSLEHHLLWPRSFRRAEPTVRTAQTFFYAEQCVTKYHSPESNMLPNTIHQRTICYQTPFTREQCMYCAMTSKEYQCYLPCRLHQCSMMGRVGFMEGFRF